MQPVQGKAIEGMRTIYITVRGHLPWLLMILKGPSLLAGLLGGSALLDFALALERQIQSACFGTLALPSAAVDPESQSFFAAPRNQMVSCPHILPLS